MSLVLAGCAHAAEVVAQDLGGTVVSDVLQIDGVDYSVDWYLPSGPALGLAVVGRMASRATAPTSARPRANRGLMALCVNASMVGGNPALAEALAQRIVGGIVAPDGRAMPERIVVGGHSAGGHFASRLGWKLASIAADRLVGAVLFDPVAASGFSDNLRAIGASGTRSVLAISSNGSPCNAGNNAYPGLLQVRADALGAGRDGFVGVQLTGHRRMSTPRATTPTCWAWWPAARAGHGRSTSPTCASWRRRGRSTWCSANARPSSTRAAATSTA